MHTFKDRNGTEWIIDLDLSLVRQIECYNFGPALSPREAASGEEVAPHYISFFPPQEDLLTDIITNPAVCFGMVWCCVRAQAKERGIEDEMDFARLFKGDHIRDARLAFYKELPDFFPEMATTLTTLIERFSRTNEVADRKVAARLMEVMGDERIEELVDRELANL